MNKTELVEIVAAKTSTSKKAAEAAVSAVLDAISEALVEGEKVQLIGFGTFEVKSVAEKEGRNPQTARTQALDPATLQGSWRKRPRYDVANHHEPRNAPPHSRFSHRCRPNGNHF